MGSARTWLILAGLLPVLVWFATSSREDAVFDERGRVVLDVAFASQARWPRIVQAMDAVLDVVGPSADTVLNRENMKAVAMFSCGGQEGDRFWSHPYGDEALDVVLNGLKKTPGMTSVGRGMVFFNFVNHLCTQIRVERELRRHPEILDEELNVLLLAGAPRSGTTNLLSIVSSHPDVTYLTLAEGAYPVSSLPERGDPRAKGKQLSWYYNPKRMANAYTMTSFTHFLRRHYHRMFRNFEPEMPFEEIILGSAVFGSVMMSTAYYIPEYETWWRKADHTPMLEFTKNALKLIQFQRRGGLPRRPTDPRPPTWILKTPETIDIFDVKAKVFKGSKMVFTHRRGVETIKSLVPFLGYLAGVHCAQDRVDYPGFAAFFVERQLYHECRMTKERLDEAVGPGNHMHIDFEAYMADPVGTALNVSAFAGLDDSERVRQAFATYVASAPREGSTAFKYDLKSFGVDEAEVDRLYEPCEWFPRRG